MRYRLAALMLFAVLSVMSLLIRPAPAPAILDIESPPKGMDPVAAPPPEPYAILDIGPPPKGETAEEHCKDTIYRLTHIHSGVLWDTGNQPAMGKLPSAPLTAVRPWLEKNIRVTKEDSERRLRLTFQAGTRAEQVAVLNTLLRVYLHTPRLWVAGRIKYQEERLHWWEDYVVKFEKHIEMWGSLPDQVERSRKAIDYLRTNRIPAYRAEIARLKQVAVIKWAQ